MLALLHFKKTIAAAGDPNGARKSWNKSTPFCRWDGVFCTRKHPGRVIALDLSGQGLSGPISPYLGNLTLLRELTLSDNSLSGPLPPLNRLHRLEVLDLGYNSLHDTIPDVVANCSNLRTIDLYHNNLVGEIPLKLGLLSNLVVSRLSRNRLSGMVPRTISNISHIEKITLSYNQLTGNIPGELGQLLDLSYLALGGNNLSDGKWHTALSS